VTCRLKATLNYNLSRLIIIIIISHFQFRLGSSSSIVVVQESMKRRLLHNSCFREESRQLSTQIGSEGGRLRVARPGIAQ